MYIIQHIQGGQQIDTSIYSQRAAREKERAVCSKSHTRKIMIVQNDPSPVLVIIYPITHSLAVEI